MTTNSTIQKTIKEKVIELGGIKPNFFKRSRTATPFVPILQLVDCGVSQLPNSLSCRDALVVNEFGELYQRRQMGDVRSYQDVEEGQLTESVRSQAHAKLDELLSMSK